MDKELISRLLMEIPDGIDLAMDEPMRNHTSFRLGGCADILAAPHNVRSLCKVLAICRNNNAPVFIMGNGTNLIVRDKGIRGVVIKMLNKFNDYIVDDEVIEAGSGILLSRLSNIALDRSLSGLEFASGIPGTLGGAVTMNAGAYGSEMKDAVIWTEYMDMYGDIKAVEAGQHQFGYRTSFIQKEDIGIVLKSRLRLKKGSKSDIKAYMDDLKIRRKENQPLEIPSAGSIFKRAEGYYTWKLIDGCGLRGYRTGGAEVSGKHCGFIVNTGNATAEDVINLIRYIRSEVRSKFGVELQTEVKIIGEE